MTNATRARIRRLAALKNAAAGGGMLNFGAGVSGIIAALARLPRPWSVIPDCSTGIGRLLIEARQHRDITSGRVSADIEMGAAK